jgi:hypothetical protein
LYVGAGGQQMLNHSECDETIKDALEILISREFLLKTALKEGILANLVTEELKLNFRKCTRNIYITKY